MKRALKQLSKELYYKTTFPATIKIMKEKQMKSEIPEFKGKLIYDRVQFLRFSLYIYQLKIMLFISISFFDVLLSYVSCEVAF